MRQGIYLGMSLVHVNVDQMRVFVIKNNVGIMINADENAKICLIKENVTKDLFDLIVNVNVINHVMLEKTQIMEIASVEKD